MKIPIITEKEVLERVDEYSLYCFYIGYRITINGRQKSPLRGGPDTDSVASFGVYERKSKRQGEDYPNEFLWKDLGMKGENFGDIFTFVQKLYNLESRLEAVWKIASDFNLEGNYTACPLILEKEQLKIPKLKLVVESRSFNSRDFAYWQQFNVDSYILDKFCCTAVKAFKYEGLENSVTTPEQAYAYRIYNRYQIYQPFAPREFKFRNDLLEYYIPGWLQLENRDLCIITKAFKDIMSLYSFDYTAVSPKGENIMLPARAIEELKKRYKRVIVLFDNDGKHNGDLYPFEKIFVPIQTGTKDITDYCKAYGPESAKTLLKTLING